MCVVIHLTLSVPCMVAEPSQVPVSQIQSDVCCCNVGFWLRPPHCSVELLTCLIYRCYMRQCLENMFFLLVVLLHLFY